VWASSLPERRVRRDQEPVTYQLDGLTQPGSRSSASSESRPGPTRSNLSASTRYSRTAGEYSHGGLDEDKSAVMRRTVGKQLRQTQRRISRSSPAAIVMASA